MSVGGLDEGGRGGVSVLMIKNIKKNLYICFLYNKLVGERTDYGMLTLLSTDENAFCFFFVKFSLLFFCTTGEHTDYGMLTLLSTDENPGLQIKLKDDSWLEVPKPKPKPQTLNPTP
jgi:isopenicillin N synthase-like dioxygenase